MGKAAAPAACLLLALAFLQPTLRLPYLGDDVFNANVDGWLGYDALSLGAGFLRFFDLTNAQAGRFYPLWSVLTFGEFHFVHGVVAIKVLVIAGILVNALTLYALLRLIAPAAALPALAVLPLTWQLRFFQDPILQSSLHMQLALEFVLLAAIVLVRYVRSGRTRWLCLGTASYACACLTYESMYALFPVFGVLAWTLTSGSARTRFAATVFYALAPIGLALATFVIRLGHPVQAHSQHDLNLALQPFAATFAFNALGALPLSYSLFDPGHFLGPAPQLWLRFVSSPAAWLVLALAFAATYLSFQGADSSKGADPVGAPSIRPALAFGVGLWLLSGTLISLSPLWQEQLTLGQAYATGYLADFGVAIVIAVLARQISTALPRRIWPVAFASCVALATLTTFDANAVATERYAPYWNMTAPFALDAGLLRAAPPGATVYLDSSYPAQTRFTDDTWHANYYLYRRTGRKYDAKPLSDLDASTPPGAFVVRVETKGFDMGVAVAGAVARVARGVDGAPIALVDTAARFLRSPGLPAELADWRSKCGAVPIDNVLEGMPSAALLAYGDGFYGPEGDAFVPWRWSSHSSYLDVVNPTAQPRLVRLTFSVRPVGLSTISVAAPGVRFSRRTADDVPVALELRVGANGSTRVNVASDGVALAHPPDPRAVLFEVRAARLAEAECSGLSVRARPGASRE